VESSNWLEAATRGPRRLPVSSRGSSERDWTRARGRFRQVRRWPENRLFDGFYLAPGPGSQVHTSDPWPLPGQSSSFRMASACGYLFSCWRSGQPAFSLPPPPRAKPRRPAPAWGRLGWPLRLSIPCDRRSPITRRTSFTGGHGPSGDSRRLEVILVCSCSWKGPWSRPGRFHCRPWCVSLP